VTIKLLHLLARPRNKSSRFRVPLFRNGATTGETRPATYGRYAEECRGLAKAMSKDNAGRLLEIADAWMALAKEAEKSPPADDE